MAKDLNHLIAVRDRLKQQLKLHTLRGEALSNKLDKVIEEVQGACAHAFTEQTSTYHTGGYDYCAETHYSLRCETCDKLLKKWTVTHHGIYG